MAKKIKKHTDLETETHSDIVAEPQYGLWLNNGENGRVKNYA